MPHTIMHKRCSVLLSFVAFCFSANGQLTHDSLLIEGHYRSFHFQKPEKNTSNKSLIFALHGSGGSGLGVMKGAEKLQRKATAENILLVYPDGYKNFWNE